MDPASGCWSLGYESVYRLRCKPRYTLLGLRELILDVLLAAFTVFKMKRERREYLAEVDYILFPR